MAGKGRKFTFHGAFKSKAAAKRRESAVGGFIRRFTLCVAKPGRKKKCASRYAVLKKK